MAGTVMVWAEAPPLRRAGRLAVVIDGVRAGLVRQGEVEVFTVEPGAHTVRVGRAGTRSNTVSIEVAEGGTHRLANYSTGLDTAGAFLLPLALLGLIPGLVFRLQVQERRPEPAPAPASPAGPAATSTAAANGLWWESDPVLSKRYKTAAPPADTE